MDIHVYMRLCVWGFIKKQFVCFRLPKYNNFFTCVNNSTSRLSSEMGVSLSPIELLIMGVPFHLRLLWGSYF